MEVGKNIYEVFFKSLIILIIIGCSITIAYLSIQAKPVHSTSIYILRDSYSNILDSNSTSFKFVIENKEGKDMKYTVGYFVASRPLKEEEIFLKSNEKLEKTESIHLENVPQTPFKVRLVLFKGSASESAKGYEVFYWITDSKD